MPADAQPSERLRLELELLASDLGVALPPPAPTPDQAPEAPADEVARSEQAGPDPSPPDPNAP